MQANTFARINFLKFLQANILLYKTNFKNCYFNSILLRKKSFSCLMTANSAVVLGPKGFKNGKGISLNTEHLFYVMLILQAHHQTIFFFNPLSLPSLSPWMTHTRPAEMIYTTIKNSMEITVAKKKNWFEQLRTCPSLIPTFILTCFQSTVVESARGGVGAQVLRYWYCSRFSLTQTSLMRKSLVAELFCDTS